MKSLTEIQKILHNRHLATLNIYRFTMQPAFQEAYRVADSADHVKVVGFIEALDHGKLIWWTKSILKAKKLYEHLDVRYLKELALDAGIRGATTMTRLELVSMLQKTGVKKHEAAID